MKSILLTVVLALVGITSSAKQATLTIAHPGTEPDSQSGYFTPLRLTLAGPVALPWGSWDVYGLEVGIWNATDVVKGLEVGAIGCSDVVKGLEIGFFNVNDVMKGLEIGVVNIVSGADSPFLPVINWAF